MMHFTPDEYPQDDMDAMENDPEWAYEDAMDKRMVQYEQIEDMHNRLAYEMLYGDEPPFDPEDTQQVTPMFEEDDEDDDN